MLRKFRESTHGAFFDGQKLNYQLLGRKPRIHKEINQNSLEKEFNKSLYFINNSLKIELPLDATMHLNSKKKP